MVSPLQDKGSQAAAKLYAWMLGTLKKPASAY